jgi:hypothetical protein
VLSWLPVHVLKDVAAGVRTKGHSQQKVKLCRLELAAQVSVVVVLMTCDDLLKV